jgi:cytochrome P450
MSGKKLADYSMADPEVAACPFEYYAKLRGEDPVHRDSKLDWYWVATHDLVVAASKDWQTFTSDHGLQQRRSFSPKAQKVWDESGLGIIGTLVQSDPPRHDDYRKVGMTVFTPKRVGEITPQIEQVIHELIDDFIGENRIDFVQRFASLLPATVVCDEYGLPRQDRARFKHWTDAIILAQSPGLTEDEEVDFVERMVQCFRYLEGHLAAAAEDPSGRVLYSIATMNHQDGTPFTMVERIWMAIAVFVGGNETTVNMLASGIYRLATEPALQQALRDDPAKLPNFVEELLRLDGSVAALVRVAAHDTEFGGTKIPAGAPVILCTGSANRDETHWPNPNEFRLDRPNPRLHLTFGYGRHACVGMHVARQELKLAFRILLERLGNIRLQNPNAGSPYLPLPYFRAIAELPIEFDSIG